MIRTFYAAAVSLVLLALLPIIALAVSLLALRFAAVAILRKIELQVIYNGDEVARRKYEWRMH